MIKASATKEAPWGFICGYPTTNGDLYGGGHYLSSAAESLTAQGKAIRNAVIVFAGEGEGTLPFSCCKRGFIPFVDGERKYACHLHDQSRKKRVLKEGYGAKEVNLGQIWTACKCDKDHAKQVE